MPSELSAEVAARELEDLRSTGALTPDRIVDAARPKGSPLHCAFEWSDGVAAEQYRLIQARQIIRSVIVRHLPSEERRVQVVTRAFVRISTDAPCQYRAISEVMSDPDHVKLLVQSAERDLRAFAKKHAALIAAVRKRSIVIATSEHLLALLEALADEEDGE